MTETKIVRAFYALLGAGDAAGALALMADDIAWTTMWHYKTSGPGPAAVAEGVLGPLLAEWTDVAMTPETLLQDGEHVVSLGRFTARHGATGKAVDAAYAHVWTVRGGRIAAFRQYIDTLAVASARV